MSNIINGKFGKDDDDTMHLACDECEGTEFNLVLLTDHSIYAVVCDNEECQHVESEAVLFDL